MKRFLILLLAGGLCAFSAGAQQTAQLLDAEGLKAANDSVLLEGYQLYLTERVAWEMEDAFHYCKTKSVDMYGGWFPVTEDGVNVKGIFFDEAKEHVVFEALMNIRTGELSSNDAVRDLTPAEIERIDKRRRMFEAVQTLDDLPRRPAGDDYMFNADIVQVDEDLFRVNQGITGRSGCISCWGPRRTGLPLSVVISPMTVILKGMSRRSAVITRLLFCCRPRLMTALRR